MTPPDFLRRARRRLRLQRFAAACAAAAALATALALARLPVEFAALAFVPLLRRGPSPLDVALAADARLNLAQRLATAVALTPAEAASPAGVALLADVAGRLDAASPGKAFPFRVPRIALLLPPMVAFLWLGPTGPPPAPPGPVASARDDATPPAPEVAEAPDELAGRPKSAELRALEAELARAGGAAPPRERLADAAALAGRLRDFQQRQFRELTGLEASLRRLRERPPGDRPAAAFAEALRRGDLAGARRHADALRDVGRRSDPGELKANAADLKELSEELRRLTNDAPPDGAGRERLRELADAAEKAARAAEAADGAKLAEAARDAGRPVDAVEAQASDLAAADRLAQRLEERQRELRRVADGAGELTGAEPPAPAGAVRSAEHRLGGPFDPRGARSFGGGSDGASDFRPATPAELGPAVARAAQEAPASAEASRLPPDARDAVRDYFRALAGK